MSEYRVISDGRSFRVQKKIFCLFWKNEEFVNIGGGFSYIEFYSLKEAKQWIRDRRKEEVGSAAQWQIVWDKDSWPEMDLSKPPRPRPDSPKRSEETLIELGENYEEN